MKRILGSYSLSCDNPHFSLSILLTGFHTTHVEEDRDKFTGQRYFTVFKIHRHHNRYSA